MSDRLPHDPPDMDNAWCPLCDEAWPCAERKRQRYEKKWCQRVMYDALMEPDSGKHAKANGAEHSYVRWEGPSAYVVDLTYGEKGLMVTVRGPDGEVHAHSDDADYAWLTRNLP